MVNIKTSESAATYDIPADGSLGLLALGYRGLVAWRAVRGTDWVDHRKVEHEVALERLKAKKEMEAAEQKSTDAIDKSTSDAETSIEIPQEVLNTLSVVIVSGLPRSGTSMMMQMLTTGGMEAFTDGAREADESNPRGYYEHEKVKSLVKNSTWLADADGKVVKVVAPLLRYLPSGPTYTIVFMERDIKEILASQSAMLDQDGRSTADQDVLRCIYERQMVEAKAWVARQEKASVIEIQHRMVISDPESTSATVNAFLCGGLSESAMASVVDTSLYREHA